MVMHSMRARTQMLAQTIGIELNPEGDILDHVSTLEVKVWEDICEGTITERLTKLEYELGVIDDMTQCGVFKEHDEQGRRKMINPFRCINAKPQHVETQHIKVKRARRVLSWNYPGIKGPQQKKPKTDDKKNTVYRYFTYLYLSFAFFLMIDPLQHLVSEMFYEFGSLSLDIFQVVGSSTLPILKVFGSSIMTVFRHFNNHMHDVYLPVLATIFWILTGYFACRLSSPKPVTTYEIINGMRNRRMKGWEMKRHVQRSMLRR